MWDDESGYPGNICYMGRSTVPKIVFEIVIEIGMEWNKHGFCNVTGSTVTIFVIEIVIEFLRTNSTRS